MGDAGYFRGTSAEQDNRFSDKEKKLMKQMRFAESLATKVDMSKIKLEVLKPWISNRIIELLGMEDDVLVEFVSNQLEVDNFPDGRRIQINLTGFLNGKNARIFTGELWDMLISAQSEPSGIPSAILEAKKDQIRKDKVEQDKLNEAIQKSMKFKESLPFLKKERDSPPPNEPDSSTDVIPSDIEPKTEPMNSREREGEKREDQNNGRAQTRTYRSRPSRSKSRSPPPPRSRNRSRSRERYDRPRDRRDPRDRFRDRPPLPDRGSDRPPRYFDRERRDRGDRRDLADEIRGNRFRRSPPYQQRQRNYSPPRRGDQYRSQGRREFGPPRRMSSPNSRDIKERNYPPGKRGRSPSPPEKAVDKNSSGPDSSSEDEKPKQKLKRSVEDKSSSSESEEWMEVDQAKAKHSPSPQPSPKESSKDKKKKKKSKKHKKHKKGKKSDKKTKERETTSKSKTKSDSSEQNSSSSESDDEDDGIENESDRLTREELERSLRERALESMKRATGKIKD